MLRLVRLVGRLFVELFLLVRDACDYAILTYHGDLDPYDSFAPPAQTPLGVVHPIDPKKPQLFRCDCGDLFWSTSPQDIQKKHCGHFYKHATNGTWREFVAIKMGRIP